MFNHCGMKFKASEIWYLANTHDCCDRVLYIGFCPRCLTDFTCLIEKTKADNIVYSKIKQGKKAEKEIELCRSDKLYSSTDLLIKKGKPVGWLFGENKEIRNKKGEIVSVEQRACDFFGQKQFIKRINVQVQPPMNHCTN